MMYDWGMDWEGMTPLIFCIVLIVALIHSPSESHGHPEIGLRTARQYLDEHLAKHEINRDEYVERRKALDFSMIII